MDGPCSWMDSVCRTINKGRSHIVSRNEPQCRLELYGCVYIRVCDTIFHIIVFVGKLKWIKKYSRYIMMVMGVILFFIG